MSNRTKKLKKSKHLFTFLHLLCVIGPFIYFIPYAFITGEMISKLSVSLTTILCLVLGAISLIVDEVHKKGLHKTILWLLLLSITLALNEVKTFIIVMSCVSIVDEMILQPIQASCKRKYLVNKEMDIRYEQ